MALVVFLSDLRRFVITSKYEDKQNEGKDHFRVSKDNIALLPSKQRVTSQPKLLVSGEVYPLKQDDVIAINGVGKAVYSLTLIQSADKMSDPQLYIQTIQDNPYICGQPVREKSFFGRKEELEEILQAISRPLKADILLVGERRIGKTSTLYRIEMQLEQPFFPVYIVLNTVEPETEKILKLIRTEIIQTLIDSKFLDASWKDHRFQTEIFERNIAEIVQAAREQYYRYQVGLAP